MKKAVKKRKKSIKKASKTTKTPRKTRKKVSKATTKGKPKTAKKIKKVSKKIWVDHLKKMQTRIDNALKKLNRDIKRKAPFEVIEKDNNELLMLLGECNYYVREFHEHISTKRKYNHIRD